MLSPHEVAVLSELTKAIQNGDRRAVQALAEKVDAKPDKTIFDYMLSSKAHDFLGDLMEGELARASGLVATLRQTVEVAGRPISQIQSAKALAHGDGATFDDARAERLLSCIRDVCLLARDRPERFGDPTAFRTQSLVYADALAEEFETVASDLGGLARLRILCELIVSDPFVPVGPVVAARLSKYALACAKTPEEESLIRRWVRHNRVSERDGYAALPGTPSSLGRTAVS